MLPILVQVDNTADTKPQETYCRTIEWQVDDHRIKLGDMHTEISPEALISSKEDSEEEVFQQFLHWWRVL